MAKAVTKVIGKVFGIDEPEVPQKTDKQKQDEAMQQEAARQEQLKTEREKSARERGASGRRTLTYTGPQSVGIPNSKLGGGM